MHEEYGHVESVSDSSFLNALKTNDLRKLFQKTANCIAKRHVSKAERP